MIQFPNLDTLQIGAFSPSHHRGGKGYITNIPTNRYLTIERITLNTAISY